jgi:phosphoribosyl-ATP pyrophosphohydrolase
MVVTFEALIEEHGEWSAVTFPKGTAKGALLHAEREIVEIINDIENKAPHSVISKEYADAIFCIMDSARRKGVSVDDILKAGYAKLQVNKARTWKDNGDGSYSHIK